MTPEELKSLIEKVTSTKSEGQHLEVKAAHEGTPERLYDTLSSFSNQDDGGILLFGVDECQNFLPVGVQDPHKLQKRVVEQCDQMEPKVRPVFTQWEDGGRIFVSAEIAGLDVTKRPCFYAAKGRIKGGFIRAGDTDKLMTEYEVYSYEAFRKKSYDELRLVERADEKALDQTLLQTYLLRLKQNRPNLSRLDDKAIWGLMGLMKQDQPSLAALMLFGVYPQVFFLNCL